MSSQQNQGGRGGGRNSTEYRGRGGGNRGRGRGQQERSGQSGSSYQPGAAPYSNQGKDTRGGKRGRGKRGGGPDGNDQREEYINKKEKAQEKQPVTSKPAEISATDQFDMLFGGDGGSAPTDQKYEESKDQGEGDANQLMDMLGVMMDGDGGENAAIDPVIVDDAIVVEDDAAIIVTDDAPNKKSKKSKKFTEDDKAIINAHKKSRPLWMDGERTKYSPKDMILAYVEQKEIDFELFDKDYLSVFEVFSTSNQLPFNSESDLVEQIDVRRFQEKPGGASLASKRYGGSKPGGPPPRGAKGDWNKNSKPPNRDDGALEDEDEEGDPEWIEFDPEKETTKFFGHVMEDEQRMRDRVIKQKENKIARAEKKKKEMLERAMNEGMTDEQRNIIAESKKEDSSANIDKDKLKEAEKLAAQIEKESYSKSDLAFESKAKRYGQEETLNDDQLVELFSEMKKENLEQREKSMQKFKIVKPAEVDNQILDDFNDELEAMRGEDSEHDDMGGLIDAAGQEYKKAGGPVEPLTPRLGLFLPQDSSEKKTEEPLNQALEDENESSVYFNQDIQNQLKQYKEQKKQFMTDNKQATALSNLDEIFKSFTVVTQQRHKIKLNEVNNFVQEPIQKFDNEASSNIDTNGSLISAIFSQINPFAQYVIQDIYEEPSRSSDKKDGQTEMTDKTQANVKNWELHENLFKRGPNHQVNKENLIKTSSQMFSVYKYYENPGMLVKSQAYTGADDYQEIKTLVPDVQFYDAPEAPVATEPATKSESQTQQKVQAV